MLNQYGEICLFHLRLLCTEGKAESIIQEREAIQKKDDRRQKENRRQRTTTSDLEKLYKYLYQNVRPAAQNLTQQEDITGPPILVSEVEYAVANLKDGKTPG
ncbi:hypothetical protein WA026_023200 [Henosepilachna vigintioctopunctata]|uniref:Uncharacterized protein n=1 Tax=Henosepilachna vigintioctopunctata TaxID=420089 RepID=A0AAW1UTD6_9CUCU